MDPVRDIQGGERFVSDEGAIKITGRSDEPRE